MADAPHGELRDALSGITRRLDQLAVTLARLGPAAAEPAAAVGLPLGEAEREAVAGVEAVLAIAPALGREAALTLAVDRVIHRAVVDCAAVFVPQPDGRLAVAVARGFQAELTAPAPGEGIVDRAFRDGEPIVARAGDERLDPLVAAHRLGEALAVPVRRAGEAVQGVLFAGRRRAVAFGAESLETALLVADRVALVLGDVPASPARAAGVPSGLADDLDLARTAEVVARAAATRLGAPHVAVLVPAGETLRLAAGVGLPADAPAPDPRLEPLATAWRTGAAWVAPGGEGGPTLAFLGAPARLVMPLRARGDVVAAIVAGGPAPLAPAALDALAGPAALAIRNARLYTETAAALAERRPIERREPTPPAAQDLGSLLALLLARIGLARERAQDASLAADLAIAEEAAWRAAEAVRAVVGFAPGQRAGMLAPLAPAALLREVVEVARARWAARGRVAPAVELDLEPLPPVRGRAEELAEALDHLLENAAEATPAGGTVVLRGRWDGGARVELSVEDAGPGMEETLRARALEPFVTTKGSGRLGLGLSVAQAIVARHQGTLELASAPGKGTRVTVALPPAAAQVAAVGPARVLVMEDDAAVRAALVELLQRQGHAVLAASDGPEGLAVVEREPVDVVFTDLTVAAVSGFDVARRVKQLRPGTPVVLITGWPGRLDPALVESSGIDRVIEKPVGAAQVLAALDSALALRRGARG